MMRYILSILLFLLSFSLAAQKRTTGTFIFPKESLFVKYVLSIDEEGRFKYFYFSCTGMKLGQGCVLETDDSIELIFERMKDGNYPEYKIVKAPGDSISIELTGYHEDRSPLAHSTVAFKKMYAGAMFDADGRVRFKTTRPWVVDTLKIQCIGYDPVFIPIAPDYSALSGVIRLASTVYFDSGDVLTLRKLADGQIELAPGQAYTRVSRSNARRIIREWKKGDVELSL